MKTEPETILVVEDEPDLREGLKHNLELDGYRVETAATGTEGLDKATKGAPTLILLDLMLPELSGLELLRRLRDSGHRTPVIILSARGQDRDKVSGLELGADDYVTKPFGITELYARRQGASAVALRGRDPTHADQPTRRGRHAQRPLDEGVGLRALADDTHGRQPHRPPAQEARGRPRRSGARRHRARHRLPLRVPAGEVT
jgi:DNA-binding response OmpR family regulator